MVCGSSYNYNKPGFMFGTSSMPFYGSSTGFSGCGSIFTQMFAGAMGGCNPFMTTYVQPNFNAMAGWAVADNLLNMGTMLVGAAIQGRKDNSVENTQDDVIQLQKKVDAKGEELKSAQKVLGSEDSGNESGLYKELADVKEILKEDGEYEKAYDAWLAKDTEAPVTNEMKKKVEAYEKALEDKKAIQAKIDAQEAKVEKLQEEYDALKAQLKEADEKLDNQQLEKIIKRKNGTAYEDVKKFFDNNGAYEVDGRDPVADLYGVLKAYKNDANANNKETYAKQFLAIYECVPAEDKEQFYSAYKLLKVNHPKIFK